MKEIRKFILDTDIGPDCDDCGALAILDRYHKAGKAQLLGITHCTSDLYSIDVIAAINEYFGVDVPIGQMERGDFLLNLEKYTAPVAEHYRKTHAAPTAEPALPLLRRLLRDNRDVTMIFIGPLNNMGDLLASAGDDISPLTGVELIKQSVSEVIVMGGHFADFTYGEYNIICDVKAAQRMAEECPVPIVYCGFEAGEKVMTGATLEACGEDYPVKLAYRHYLDGGYIRNSWDLVTVYYALEPDLDRWVLSEECKIRYNDDGTAVVSEGTGAKYVRYAADGEIAEILNGIIGLVTEI